MEGYEEEVKKEENMKRSLLKSRSAPKGLDRKRSITPSKEMRQILRQT